MLSDFSRGLEQRSDVPALFVHEEEQINTTLARVNSSMEKTIQWCSLPLYREIHPLLCTLKQIGCNLDKNLESLILEHLDAIKTDEREEKASDDEIKEEVPSEEITTKQDEIEYLKAVAKIDDSPFTPQLIDHFIKASEAALSPFVPGLMDYFINALKATLSFVVQRDEGGEMKEEEEEQTRRNNEMNAIKRQAGLEVLIRVLSISEKLIPESIPLELISSLVHLIPPVN